MTTTTKTFEQIHEAHRVEIPAHLEAQAEVPVLSGVQRQGDLIVIPRRGRPEHQMVAVPDVGVTLVRGQGGNTHLLVADGPVTFAHIEGGQDVGVVDVPSGAAAFLLHPEHGAQGVAPGRYTVRRQREQADEIRIVAD